MSILLFELFEVLDKNANNLEIFAKSGIFI